MIDYVKMGQIIHAVRLNMNRIDMHCWRIPLGGGNGRATAAGSVSLFLFLTLYGRIVNGT